MDLHTLFSHDWDDSLRLMHHTLKAFAEREIVPLAGACDTTCTFPRALWLQLGQLGVLGMTVLPEYGGSNMGYLAHVLAMEEISRASASIGLSYAAHSNLCINQIHLHGSTEQKKKFLPALITGEKIGALAMSESGAGSDIMGMQCHAQASGDHYILNGSKMWITNATEAETIVVYAKTESSQEKQGITAFIVEKSVSPFLVGKKLDKLGMRGSPTAELVFSHVKVPQENILGELNGGTKILMQGLDYERLILAAGPVGIMQACLDCVLPYVKERKQFGRAIGEFELIQAKIADMYTALGSSRAYLYAAAKACDAGQITRYDSASVILMCAEQATRCALDAIQCLGGNGYMNEYLPGRLLRDAKLYEIGAGTSEIRRILIGRELQKRDT